MRGRKKIYASDAERQTARRVRRYAMGLNSAGKPYQRHPNFVNHKDTPATQRRQLAARRARKLAMKRAWFEQRARERRAAGLRVDGRPFRRLTNFHAWQQLRAGMVVDRTDFYDHTRKGGENYE